MLHSAFVAEPHGCPLTLLHTYLFPRVHTFLGSSLRVELILASLGLENSEVIAYSPVYVSALSFTDTIGKYT